MMKKIRTRKGFTLIELMIVVAIIGILAAIAIPNFMKFQCRSKQSEAKTLLSGLFTAEATYFGEFNKYLQTRISVGFTPASVPRYYTFDAITLGTGSKSYTATVAGDPDGDSTSEHWGITGTRRDPQVTTNDCL